MKNYNPGEVVLSYYVITDGINRATENFYNLEYSDNNSLLTSLRYTKGQLKWKYETTGGTIGSAAIASDGTIYVGVVENPYYYRYECTLHALYPNGKLKWKHLITTNTSRKEMYYVSSPVIADDGTIYVSSSDDYLYAIRPNGSLKWKYAICYTCWMYSSPAIASDGTIYLGTGAPDQAFYAINPDGTLKWKYFAPDQNIYYKGSPAIASDGTIYVVGGGWLYVLNLYGTLRWKYLTGNVYTTPSIANDGTIYVMGNSYLYALYPNSTLKWKYLYGGYAPSQLSSPSISNDGTIYIIPYQYLYALDCNGRLKWQYYTGAAPRPPAIASDGTIYAATMYNFYAINYDGSLKWNYGIPYYEDFSTSCPLIASDGTLYLVKYTNYPQYSYAIHAISYNGYFIAPPWPKFQQNNFNTGSQLINNNLLQLFDFRYLNITMNELSSKSIKMNLTFYKNVSNANISITTMYIDTIVVLPSNNSASITATNSITNTHSSTYTNSDSQTETATFTVSNIVTDHDKHKHSRSSTPTLTVTNHVIPPSSKDYRSSACINKPILINFIEKGKKLVISTKNSLRNLYFKDSDKDPSSKYKKIYNNTHRGIYFDV